MLICLHSRIGVWRCARGDVLPVTCDLGDQSQARGMICYNGMDKSLMAVMYGKHMLTAREGCPEVCTQGTGAVCIVTLVPRHRLCHTRAYEEIFTRQETVHHIPHKDYECSCCRKRHWQGRARCRGQYQLGVSDALLWSQRQSCHSLP